MLPKLEELKYLGVSFTSEGRAQWEAGRCVCAASAVMQTGKQKR